MPAKLATVLGATGYQGTAAVNALFENLGYRVRALTRRPESDAAIAMAAKGIEMVQADIADVDSLKKALAGSSLVFAVTDFYAQFDEIGAQKSMELEIQQGRNIVVAVQATPTIEHFIYSTLPRSLDISGGKFPIPHFNGKNAIAGFVKSDPILLSKTTFLFLGWYDTNFKTKTFTPTLHPATGQYVVIGDYPPDTPIAVIGDTKRNLKPFISAIIAQPEKYKNGTSILVSREEMTFQQMLQKWETAHDKKAVYIRTDSATYFKLWPGWAEEMSTMMQFWDEYRGRQWSDPGREVLGAAELGITARDLVSLEESLREEGY